MAKTVMRYSEDVIAAVKYLILKKGVTRSTEIAQRLGISPYTARNIKKILRDRGVLDKPKRKVKGRIKSKSVKGKYIIEEILGGK